MILILGGMKSGKSSFASRLAAGRGASVAYLATARAGDAEMEQRIRRHQAERPDSWLTVEEPDNPASYFRALTGSNAPEPVTILLDCLTLWLTNLLAPLGDEPDRDEALRLGENAAEDLLKAVTDWERAANERRITLIVSNQVENGLVSPWPLGRIFQDLAGLTHQKFAAAASEVYVMNAGRPLRL